MRETPNFAKQKFLYRLSRSDYEKEWGKTYQKPGFGVRLMALLLRFLPKVGPLKALDFNIPTPQTEDMYFKSINLTVDQYRAFLEATRKRTISLPDQDLDSGKPTTATEYSLADETYAKLLSQLSDHKFDQTTVALQKNILTFYSNPAVSVESKKRSRAVAGHPEESRSAQGVHSRSNPRPSAKSQCCACSRRSGQSLARQSAKIG